LRPALHAFPWLSFAFLILSRLSWGVGESLGSTGSTLWGISSAGRPAPPKSSLFNGISTYGAMALGAPLAVALDSLWGNPQWAWLQLACSPCSLAPSASPLAYRKSPVPVTPGEHLSFRHVLGRVAPHGMGLALAA